MNDDQRAIEALVGPSRNDPVGCPDNPRGLYGRKFTASIKAALRAAFPGVAFGVRGSRGTGTGWYRVEWVDGPTAQQVAEITARYQSSSFDSSTDGYEQTGARAWREGGEWVRGTSCGVHHNRTISDRLADELAHSAEEGEGANATLPIGPYSGGTWGQQWPWESERGNHRWSWAAIIGRRAENEPDRGARRPESLPPAPEPSDGEDPPPRRRGGR